MARKNLPSAVVPDEAHALIEEYAHEKRMSMSEAVRQLLQTSPDLQEFAKKRGMPVNFMDIEAWRGSRKG